MKERKGNFSTKSQNFLKSSGQVDLGISGQINLGILRQTLRVGGKMIGTQQIPFFKHQQPLRSFNMSLSVNCDFRILVLPNTLILFSLTDWIFRPLHAKLLFLPIFSYRLIFGSQRFCVQRRPRQSAGSRKEDPMHFGWNGNANSHREQKSQLPTTVGGGH